MANKFWVGGTGTWDGSTATNWSDTDGGVGGAVAPTTGDDVFFTTLSNATDYTVTMGASAVCRDCTFTAPLAGNVTWAGSTAMSIAGSLALYNGMVRTYFGTISMTATTTGKTITFNSTTLSAVTFSGVGGGWTLADTWAISLLVHSAGSLTMAASGACSTRFSSTGSTTRSLTLGSTTLTCGSLTGNLFGLSSTGLTLDAGTSTIVLVATGVGFSAQFGGKTLYNLTIQNSSGYAAFTPDAVTVSNNLTITGLNASTTRLIVQSGTPGAPAVMTCSATVALSNVDFEDVTGAGGGAGWATGTSIGNCGGNSGITFTPAVTAKWRTDTGNLPDPAKWDTGLMPLPQDAVVFDASSFTTTGRVVTNSIAGLRIGGMDWSAATNAPQLTTSNALSIYGSYILSSGVILSGTGIITMRGRGAHLITSAAHTFAAAHVITAQGGSYTHTDAYVNTSTLTMNNGTWNTGGFAITLLQFITPSSIANTLNLGASLITLTGTGNVWGNPGSSTVNAGTSTIKITDTSATSKTFQGATKSYYNVWFAGGGAGIYIITATNTFNQIKGDTPTAASTLQFTAATTTTITDWQLAGTLGHTWTITSVTAANHTLRFLGAAPLVTDYLVISRSQASPGYKWFAGANSTDGGNNAGWLFRIAGANKPQLLS